MLVRHVKYTLKPGKAGEFWKIAKEVGWDLYMQYTVSRAELLKPLNE